MDLHVTKKTNNKFNNDSVSICVTKVSSTKSTKSTKSLLYQCEYCNKILSSRQSKWRHVKSCDNKNQIEKRLEILEDKITSNIDSTTIVNLMNLNISSIKTFCQMINDLYYNESLKKITKNIQSLICNNIKSFQFLSKNKAKFEKYLTKQINYNLAFINKLEDCCEYIEFMGKKQYLFRNQVNCLKEIKINNDNQIKTIEFVDFSEDSEDHNYFKNLVVQSNTVNCEKYQLSDSDELTSDSENSEYNI